MADGLYNAARAVLASMAFTMEQCGLESPKVAVVRQGQAADDECPCSGVLVALVQFSQSGDGRNVVQVGQGVSRTDASCVPRLQTVFRIRYTRCWPAVPKGNPPSLPSLEQVDAASKVQLAYLSAFQLGVTSGAWLPDVPESLRWEEWTVSRIDPVIGGGCAGWQCQLSVSHSPGV